jgi:hypothetical protein
MTLRAHIAPDPLLPKVPPPMEPPEPFPKVPIPEREPDVQPDVDPDVPIPRHPPMSEPNYEPNEHPPQSVHSLESVSDDGFALIKRRLTATAVWLILGLIAGYAPAKDVALADEGSGTKATQPAIPDLPEVVPAQEPKSHADSKHKKRTEAVRRQANSRKAKARRDPVGSPKSQQDPYPERPVTIPMRRAELLQIVDVDGG